MKLCLALAFQNEEQWLRLHAPVWLQATFDGIVALDGGSQDGGADYLRSVGATIVDRPFDWDFGAHFNALMDYCAELGYDAMFRIDPDELFYPTLIDDCRGALELGAHGALIGRVGFVKDRVHWNYQWFPDYQARVMRLDKGLRYTGKVHESVIFEPNAYATEPLDPKTILYHYGWILPLSQRTEREMQYARIRGLDVDPAAYANAQYPPHIPFTGPQPLDPAVVGRNAPFGGNKQ